jgi:coatomer subunit gamma
LNEVTARELQPAVTVLQLFLSSSKPILRFAAIRALNKVAMNNPSSITTCNEDMESNTGNHHTSKNWKRIFYRSIDEANIHVHV